MQYYNITSGAELVLVIRIRRRTDDRVGSVSSRFPPFDYETSVKAGCLDVIESNKVGKE